MEILESNIGVKCSPVQQCSVVFYADFPQTCAATALCRPRDHIFQAAPVTPYTTPSQLHNSLHNCTAPSTTARLPAQLHNSLHNFIIPPQLHNSLTNFTTPSTTSQLPPQSGLFCTTALYYFTSSCTGHTTLNFTVLHLSLPSPAQHFSALHCTMRRCTALHSYAPCTSLLCKPLHCTALHNTVQCFSLLCKICW